MGGGFFRFQLARKHWGETGVRLGGSSQEGARVVLPMYFRSTMVTPGHNHATIEYEWHGIMKVPGRNLGCSLL